MRVAVERVRELLMQLPHHRAHDRHGATWSNSIRGTNSDAKKDFSDRVFFCEKNKCFFQIASLGRNSYYFSAIACTFFSDRVFFLRKKKQVFFFRIASQGRNSYYFSAIACTN